MTPKPDAEWSPPTIQQFDLPEDLIAYAEPRLLPGQEEAFIRLVEQMRAMQGQRTAYRRRSAAR